MNKRTVYIPFTLDWQDAFTMLCELLGMKNLVQSEDVLCIHNGKVCKYDKETNEYISVDDRADLFAALRNVANAMIPNCDFRSDKYITNWGDDCPTNADMIRRMSDNELLNLLGGPDGVGCFNCTRRNMMCDTDAEDCDANILNWLKSEADL